MPPKATPQGHPTLYSNSRGRHCPLSTFLEQSKATPQSTMCQTLGSPHLTGRPIQRQHKQSGLLYTKSDPEEGKLSLFTRRDYTGKLQLPELSEDSVITLSRAKQMNDWMPQCASPPLSVATAGNNSFFRNSDGSTTMERASTSPQHCTSNQQLGFLPLGHQQTSKVTQSLSE